MLNNTTIIPPNFDEKKHRYVDFIVDFKDVQYA